MSMADKNTLLVYYSFEGNSESVAEMIREKAGFDLEKLIPDKEPPRKGPGKFLAGGGSIINKECVGIKDLEKDPASYGRIILLCPVWASSFPPAMRTFLAGRDLSGKEVYMIGCSSSGHAGKMFSKTEKFIGKKLDGTLSLRDPLKFKEEAEAAVSGFLGSLQEA